jgi:serine/threonine protein kinase
MGGPGLQGELIDTRYRLGAMLSSDDLGEVYAAEQIRLGRSVAVKILAAERITDRRGVERFLREAGALATIQHPNIVFVVDFGFHDSRPYIVREQAVGRPLERILIERGALPVHEALPILIQISEALEHAHQRKIVHRDLKPANVFIGDNGRVQLVDLGLIRLLSPSPPDEEITSITGPGVFKGRSAYTAPELISGQPADARSDLYSLGAIAHHLLTGRAPGEGKTLASAAAALPKEAGLLLQTVQRLLAQAPNDRFASAHLALNALNAAAADLAPLDASSDAELLRSAAGRAPTATQPGLQVKLPAPADLAGRSRSDPHPSLSWFQQPETKPKLKRWREPSTTFSAPTGFWNLHGQSIKVVAALVYLAAIGGAVGYYAFGPPDAARDARTLVRAGQTPNVIPQLEHWLERPNPDPRLESALGYAWISAKKPKKALAAYARAAASDPKALEPADVAALVALLGLPEEDSREAQRTLGALKDAALPWLRQTANRPNADSYLRCRAADVLTEFGGQVDAVAVCVDALENKSCAKRKAIARRLAELDDPRARHGLETLAAAPVPKNVESDDDCGRAEARSGLARPKPKPKPKR